MRRAALCALATSLCAAPASADPELELGKKVFTEIAQPHCTLCHALADAGAEGQIGPDLDTLKPDAGRVKAAVVNGINAMPGFADSLSPEQIAAVARYVATATGQPK